MSSSKQCVILVVMLIAMAGILTAAEPSPDELRRKGQPFAEQAGQSEEDHRRVDFQEASGPARPGFHLIHPSR